MIQPGMQDHLISLNEAVLAISSEQELDGVLQMVVDRARELVGARYAALGVPEADGHSIGRILVSGLDPEKVEEIGHMPSGRGLLGAMRREGRSLRLASLTSDPRSVGFPPNHPRMESFLGVPIRRGDEILGELYLTEKDDPDGFSEDDRRMAEMLARHAALAIVNARLLGRVAASEERYRLLTEGAPEIVFTLDAAGCITYVNNRARTVTGFKPEAMRGRHLREVVRTEDRQVVDVHLRDMQSGGERTSFAVTGIAVDGGVRHLEISLVPFGQPGRGFLGIACDATERRERERDLAERTAELLTTREERERLREFVALVIQAQEDERARIAGDLHDTTVQTLTAIGRRLRGMSVEAEGEQPGPDDISEELDELAAAALDEAVDLRRLSRNLRPSVLDHLGLAAGLQQLAEELRESGIEVSIAVDGDASTLDDRERTALFRIAQEAMTNIRRHSGASRVEAELSVRKSEARLCVSDDGRGFAAGTPTSLPGLSSSHLGLVGMHERAAMLGGSLKVTSSEREGTRVVAEIPLDR